MRKCIFAAFACVCMTLAMIPASVFAESSDSVEVGNVDEEDVVTLNAGSPYATTDEDGNVTTEGAAENNYNIMF